MKDTGYSCGGQKIKVGDTLGYRTMDTASGRPDFRITYYLVIGEKEGFQLLPCEGNVGTPIVLDHDLGPRWFVAAPLPASAPPNEENQSEANMQTRRRLQAMSRIFAAIALAALVVYMITALTRVSGIAYWVSIIICAIAVGLALHFHGKLPKD